MASPTLDDVEFEAENIKNANDLKGVNYTFSSASMSLLFHLHFQLIKSSFQLPFEENFSSL